MSRPKELGAQIGILLLIFMLVIALCWGLTTVSIIMYAVFTA